VPVIENSRIDATISEAMDLVLASAERLGAVGSGLSR
jgi:2-phosphoglycerate kinase